MQIRKSHRSVTRPALSAIATALLLGACGGGDDAGSPSGPRATETVTAATGGTVATRNNEVRLVIPPGALASNTNISVTPAQLTAVPTTDVVPNTAYTFGPSGTTFAQPVSVSIQVPPGVIPDGVPPVTVGLHRLSDGGGTWTRVPGSVYIPSTGGVTAQLSSFSTYAVLFLGAVTDVVLGGATQSAPIGTAVPTRPSVVVRSDKGYALAGLRVTFTVTSGGGTVTGGVQTTDAQGRATVGGWTLGATPGANTLSATVEGYAQPIVFTATATVGPPATITVVSGAGQTAFPGDPLALAPVVELRDASGNPTPGITVQFAAGNQGSVANASTVTDAQGRASAGAWTLGARPFADPRTNTLTVTAPGLLPLSLSAEVRDPCDRPLTSTTLGATRAGTLRAGFSCLSGTAPSQRSLDRYLVTLPAAATFEQVTTSATFGASQFWYPQAGTPQITGRGRTTPGTLRDEFVLPPGTYEFRVGNQAGDPATQPAGAYTTELRTIAEPNVGCTGVNVWMLPGSSVTANLTAADCTDTFANNDRRVDGYVLLLQPGQTVTVTVTATIPYIFSRFIGDTFITAFGAVPAGQSRAYTVTADQAAFHSFYVLNENIGQYGSYTVSVSSGGPALRADAAAGATLVLPGHDRR